jgi:hypothetical protein
MSLTDDLKKLVGIPPRFPHAERDLAAAYGLASDRLKEVRTGQHLKRGEHWDLVKGLVCYNAAGKAALETALNIASEKNTPESAPGAGETPPSPVTPPEQPLSPPDSAPNDPPPEPPPAKNFVAPLPGEERTLVCIATVRNRHQLKARDEDRLAWVRVRDSKNFRPGMKFQARFLQGEQWELVGRCPRWGGKF